MNAQEQLEAELAKVAKVAAVIVAESERVSRDRKKVADQLDDAMDEIYRLKIACREKDEIIAELQQVNTGLRTGR